ncbi:hypothetical protein BD560DRAFT_409756 [Blakeslea trispora]|nr:hypothetical protein BD560DRAFT_409756 [Blakeslea trispora]
MRPLSEWSLKGRSAVAATPTGRAVSRTVLAIITATKFPKKNAQSELKSNLTIIKEKHQLEPISRLQKVLSLIII